MVHVESFNFDIGVKNYKKNRLIVNPIHLLNEILFNVEKTSKSNFRVGVVGYLNNKNNPLSFFNVKRDLETVGLDKSFNFYVNRKGNIITDVEMSDVNYFYPTNNYTTNVIICLSSFTKNSNNVDVQDIYSPEQITTLSKIMEILNFDNIDVPKDLSKIVNAGFDIKKFSKELGLS